MAKAILNNVLVSGNEDEAIRDGWYVKKPDGRIEIQQNALKAFEAAAEKMERLAGILRDGLLKGASVELGGLDAGLFKEKDYNFSREYLAAFAAKLAALGVDVDALKAEAKSVTGSKFSAPRLRVFDVTDKDAAPKGERLAPTPDGSPVPVAAADPGKKSDAA